MSNQVPAHTAARAVQATANARRGVLDTARLAKASPSEPTFDRVGVTSDNLMPVSQLRQLAGATGVRARLHLVDSRFGHDAFLKSTQLPNPLLERLLSDLSGEIENE